MIVYSALDPTILNPFLLKFKVLYIYISLILNTVNDIIRFNVHFETAQETTDTLDILPSDK